MPGISAGNQVIGNSDLVRQILLHLDQGSLLSCLTVSESLFKISGPLLYRHIAVTHPSAFQRLITRINPPYRTRRSSRFPHTKRLLGCTKSISLSAWLWSQPRFPYSPEHIATTLFPDGLDTVRLEHYETMCERPHRPHTSKCIIRLAFLLQPKHLVLNLTGVKQVFKCLAENEVVAMANRLDHLTIRLSPHSSETYSAAEEILRVSTLAQKTSIILAEGFPNSESRMKLYQAHLKGHSPLPTIGRLVELIKHLARVSRGNQNFTSSTNSCLSNRPSGPRKFGTSLNSRVHRFLVLSTDS